MVSKLNILQSILSNKKNTCSLCFKYIDDSDNKIYTKDEVVIAADKTEIMLEINEIISFVLGPEFSDPINMLEVLCKPCTQSMINNYTFINMCRENSQYLCNVIQNLTTTFENTKSETYNFKTLFACVDMNNFVTKLYYDKKSIANSSPQALKRLQHIVNKKNTKRLKVHNTDVDHTFIHQDNVKDTDISNKINKKSRSNINVELQDIIANDDSLNFKCKFCLKTYASSVKLKSHYIRVHGPKNFKCPECSKSFGSPALLDEHKQGSHCTVICSECGKVYHSKISLKQHELNHKMKLICMKCGKCYKNKITLKHHINMNTCGQMRRSSSQGQFICDICNKRFCHKSSLRVHICFDHGNAKAYICTWCNKKFPAQSKLKAHIVKHTQEKNFWCSICGGKFVTKESLLYHTRIHTGEKPYQCQFCDQRFLSSSRRAEHLKVYHMNLTLECDICHSKFKSHSYLKKHKSRHFNPSSKMHYSLETADTEV